MTAAPIILEKSGRISHLTERMDVMKGTERMRRISTVLVLILLPVLVLSCSGKKETETEAEKPAEVGSD